MGGIRKFKKNNMLMVLTLNLSRYKNINWKCQHPNYSTVIGKYIYDDGITLKRSLNQFKKKNISLSISKNSLYAFHNYMIHFNLKHLQNIYFNCIIILY